MTKPKLPGVRLSKELKGQMTEAVESLALPRYDCVVLGGAALQLNGIRQANDVDVLVSESFFEFLRKRKVYRPTTEYDNSEGFRTSVEVFRISIDPKWQPSIPRRKILKAFFVEGFEDAIGPKSFESAMDDIVMLGTIPTMSLGGIKRGKEHLGRPKDIEDVALIDLHLERGAAS